MYIGKTVNPERRYFAHANPEYYKTDKTYFGRAKNKYGIDSFEYSILEENIPEEQLSDKEVYYISKFDSVSNGYNSTPGGEGGNTYIRKTEEEMFKIKKKISRANSGSNNGNKGQFIGEKNSMYGKKQSDETKHKISIAQKGKIDSEETRKKKSLNNARAKKVKVTNEDGSFIIYRSIKLCSETENIDRYEIEKLSKSGNKTTNGKKFQKYTE